MIILSLWNVKSQFDCVPVGGKFNFPYTADKTNLKCHYDQILDTHFFTFPTQKVFPSLVQARIFQVFLSLLLKWHSKTAKIINMKIKFTLLSNDSVITYFICDLHIETKQ